MKNTLLTALLLASALKAQTTIIKPGSHACGDRAIPEIAFIDASAANEMGDIEEAFLPRWLDPRPTTRHIFTALFTRTRCIAKDGDEAGGKYIDRIWGDSLTVSKGGFVAYEADYWDSLSEKLTDNRARPHRGVYIERKFAFEIDPKQLHWDFDTLKRIDMQPDFVVTAEGRVIPNPEVMMPAPRTPPAKE